MIKDRNIADDANIMPYKLLGGGVVGAGELLGGNFRECLL